MITHNNFALTCFKGPDGPKTYRHAKARRSKVSGFSLSFVTFLHVSALLFKKKKNIRQQKQKPELDGAHWRLLYCLLFCNADWGCHVEKGYYSFLKLLKNPAGSLKNVWMPSVFASSLFRHKRYTQRLPQCDKAIIKKKIHFGVLSDFCASSVLTLLLAETKAHPRLCFVKRNDAFYRMESKEEKFHPTVCMFKLHKQHSTEICWTAFEIILCMYVYLYMCVSVLSASTHSSEVEYWDTSIALPGS